MKKNDLKRIFTIAFIVYAVFAVAFYYLSGDQLKYRVAEDKISILEADSVTPEIVRGLNVSQSFLNTVDNIEQVSLIFTKLYRDGKGLLTIDLLDGDDLLYRKILDVEKIPEQHRVYLEPENPIRGLKGKTLTISIYSNSKVNEGVSAMMNKSISPDGSKIMIGNEVMEGSLCFSLSGSEKIEVSQYYWFIMGGFGLFLAALFLLSYHKYLNGRNNYLVTAISAMYRYQFLISQLVIRDFKSKYKRSILGVFWSFLNPLLTMTVQFLVFSTFFSSDTKNYPVYLLCGVVCFSFFNECTTMCLSSISGNARLITKVYIPKYIFPLARTISSSVNLAISLVPLFLASVILGIAIRPQAILFFYFLACLILFSLGVGMFLSALMVFFRDIQFLWSVLMQIWMYATPIFYPAEIIPEKYKFIVRFNPLYHFIGNCRTCLINGISPEPRAYIFCLLFALLSLLIGSYTFKKTQDKFALYL
ncbi:MAG: ABC transporter permease [Erysipelotrichaceae bacterium]|nr:ABC transporter permease [Erysipelotrichaceae bacterium]